MTTALSRLAAVSLLAVLVLALPGAGRPVDDDSPTTQPAARAMNVQYLEIVTPDVDATCRLLERMHRVRFSAPIAELGQARTAALDGGGRLGVRAPMRETEAPVVRPYLLVDDPAAAVKAAADAGAEIAMPAMAIPGQGTFAIYILGGNQYGVWKPESAPTKP